MAERKKTKKEEKVEMLKKFLKNEGVDIEVAAKERIAMKERIKKLTPRMEAAEQQATFIGSFEVK